MWGWFSSTSAKLANSSVGHKIIVRRFGIDGERIENGFSSALAHHYEAKQGKSLMNKLFSLVIEINLLIEQGKLTLHFLRSSASGIKDVNYAFAKYCLAETSTESEVTSLRQSINALEAKLLPALEAVCSSKFNEDTLLVIQRLGDQSFLSRLLLDPTFAHWKHSIGLGLSSVISKQPENIEEKTQSEVLSQTLDVLGGPDHIPSLHELLSIPVLKPYFFSFLASTRNLNVLQFRHEVEQFKAMSTKSLRVDKACKIIHKYVASDAEQRLLIAAMSVEIRHQLVESAPDPASPSCKPSLFDNAYDATLQYLHTLYPTFLESEAYELLQDRRPLPRHNTR